MNANERPNEGRLSESIPLLAHTSPEAPVAYRAGKAVAAWQFLADVEHLAELMSPGVAVLNACTDRYHFAVGLAAAVIADHISLLPPTHAPEVVRQIRAMTPAAICLTDHRDCSIDLPQIMFPDTRAPRAALWRVPLVPRRAPRCQYLHVRFNRAAAPALQALGVAGGLRSGRRDAAWLGRRRNDDRGRDRTAATYVWF